MDISRLNSVEFSTPDEPSISVEQSLGSEIFASGPEAELAMRLPDQRKLRKLSPINRRIQSVRLPDDASHLYAENHARLLNRDLKYNTRRNLPHIITHFCDHVDLPFKVDVGLLGKLTDIYDEDHGRWKTFKGIQNEGEIADFMNSIIDCVASVGGFSQEHFTRKWTSRQCCTVMKDHSTNRKPDVILVDEEYLSSLKWHEAIEWHRVVSITETSVVANFNKLQDTINSKSHLMFLRQDDRIFAPVLAFSKNGYRLVLTDRRGQLQSSDVLINSSAGKDTLSDLLFLRLILSLSCGSLHRIGLDKTMVRDVKTGAITQVSVGQHIVRIHQVVFNSQTLVGRATKVYTVADPHTGAVVAVLKDSWIHRIRTEEKSFLQQLDHPHLPKIFRPTWNEAYTQELPTITTQDLRMFFAEKNSIRDRRRVLTAPFGKPISTVTSSYELVGAGDDILSGLEHLKSLGIYHRDVSYNNILLYQNSNINSQRRSGLLIDLDYAIYIEDLPKVVPKEDDDLSPHSGSRTGTAPFMAIELLYTGGVHQYEYDLESLLYVLLLVCIRVGDEGEIIQSPDESECGIFGWLRDEGSYKSLAVKKAGHMTSIESTLLSQFSTCFQDLKPLFLELRFCFWEPGRRKDILSGSDITAESMSACLKKHCKALEEGMTPRPIEKTGHKRAITGDHDGDKGEHSASASGSASAGSLGKRVRHHHHIDSSEPSQPSYRLRGGKKKGKGRV